MGHPEKEGVEVGPVVDEAQFKRIGSIIDSAIEDEQGKLLVGGKSTDSQVSQLKELDSVHSC